MILIQLGLWQIIIITIFLLPYLQFIQCAPSPFHFPYFQQFPYYFPGIMPQMPIPYPYNYPNYHSPVMPGIVPQAPINPNLLNYGPGAESIATGLNLPGSQGGMVDENITRQLGNFVQLSSTPKDTNIPLGLLSSKVPQSKSPQIGAASISPAVSIKEKVASLPVLYN